MSSEGPGAVTLGFDLDAGPIATGIDRVGASAERAAGSAEKLAAAGERIGTGFRSAAVGQDALVRDTLRLNALLNQAEKLAGAANTIDLANKRAVTSMVTEISAVRALSAEMGGLTRVEELAAQAIATLDARQREVALSALGVSTATKAVAAESAAAGASTGLLSRALGAITGVATGAGTGIAGLAGSLASMVIGGFVISGVIAGIGAIVAWYDKLTESSRKAKEAAEAFTQSDAARAARSIAVADVQAHTGAAGASVPGVAPTKAIDDARNAVTGLNAQLKESRSLSAGFMENLSPRLFLVSSRLRELEAGLATNRLTSDQFTHALHELERAFPDYAPQIAAAAQLGATYGAAADQLARLTAEFQNAQAESRSLSSAFGTDGMAGARKALADAQSRVGALRSGGVAGLDVRDAQLETVERATALWKEYVTTKDGARSATLSFSEALGQGNAKAVEAYRLAQQTIGADQAVTKGKEAIAEAERKAREAARDAAREAARNAAEQQKALDAYFSGIEKNKAAAFDRLKSLEAENAATRAMIAAMLEGKDAVDRLTISQAGDNAVRELGIGVSERTAAAIRREAEEKARLAIVQRDVADAQRHAEDAAKRAADEAQRDMERRARDLHRTVSSAIEGILTDVSNRKNPIVALFENGKRAAIHAASEMLTAQVEGKVADVLGITLPASKQEKAALDMNTAAEKQLQAARLFLQAAGFDPGSSGLVPTSPSTIPRDGSVALPKYAQQFLKVAGAAYGGYQAGYGIGQSTQSAAGGAIAGAMSGAAMGAAVGGWPGAVAGGLAGLVGGLLGARDAARAAAEQLKAVQVAAQQAAEDYHAQATGDDFTLQLRQAAKDFSDVMAKLAAAGAPIPADWAQYEVTAPGAQSFSQAIDDYLKIVARIIQRHKDALDDQYADFHANYLDAIGQHDAADKYRRDSKFARDRRDLVASFGDTIDPDEQRTLNEFDRWRAAVESNTAAVNTLTTTMRGQPSGFKTEDLNRYIQQYATAMPVPGTFTPPLNPLIPSTRPNYSVTPTTTATTTSSDPAPVFLTMPGAVFNINGNRSGEEMLGEIAAALDDVKERSLGGSKSITRAEALQRVAAQRGARPSIS